MINKLDMMNLISAKIYPQYAPFVDTTREVRRGTFIYVIKWCMFASGFHIPFSINVVYAEGSINILHLYNFIPLNNSNKY